MSFLGKTTFWANLHAQHCWLCHVIYSDMLNMYHSPAQLFLFTFLFQCNVSFRGCPDCIRVWSPCIVLFLMWLILLMLCTIIGSLIFRVLGLLYPVMAPGLVLCTRCILPCKNSRELHSCCIKWPFGCLVWWSPYTWTKVLLKLIYVMKVVQPLFSFHTSLPHFECDLKAWYYSSSSIHAYWSQCGSWIFIMGKVDCKVKSTSSHSSDCISSLLSTENGCVGILTYQLMSAILYLGKSTTSLGLGVECFQPPLDISGGFCVSSSSFNSPGSIKVPVKTCLRSIQTTYSGGTLLDGGFLASHSSQHVGKYLLIVPS